jgi:hypothetical protein
VPPPWETGPWPGPGQARPVRSAAPRESEPGTAAPGSPAPAGLPAGIVLAAGIVPLVVPGLVTGIVGLRRARLAGSSQLASWAAIALSVVWAVVLILVFAGGNGSQPNACAGYPAPVRQAYTSAVTDLARTTVGAAQAADIRHAAAIADGAAAAASGQNSVRSSLAELADDLEQAGADVTAHRQVPAALLQALAADGTRLAAACPAH